MTRRRSSSPGTALITGLLTGTVVAALLGNRIPSWLVGTIAVLASALAVIAVVYCQYRLAIIRTKYRARIRRQAGGRR